MTASDCSDSLLKLLQAGECMSKTVKMIFEKLFHNMCELYVQLVPALVSHMSDFKTYFWRVRTACFE